MARMTIISPAKLDPIGYDHWTTMQVVANYALLVDPDGNSVGKLTMTWPSQAWSYRVQGPDEVLRGKGFATMEEAARHAARRLERAGREDSDDGRD